MTDKPDLATVIDIDSVRPGYGLRYSLMNILNKEIK
jgi:hypothetical protein